MFISFVDMLLYEALSVRLSIGLSVSNDPVGNPLPTHPQLVAVYPVLFIPYSYLSPSLCLSVSLSLCLSLSIIRYSLICLYFHPSIRHCL